MTDTDTAEALTGSEWVLRMARSRPGARIGIVADTLDLARGMAEAIAAAAEPGESNGYSRYLNAIRFNNGTTVTVFHANNPDRMRGRRQDFLWIADGTRESSGLQGLTSSAQAVLRRPASA